MHRAESNLKKNSIEHCRWMNAVEINQGTSGNVSVRSGDVMLITPSGIGYDVMSPRDIRQMPIARTRDDHGAPPAVSTEWRFHRAILHARPEAGAVVHTHSTYATVLAICRREIPACHYMVAAAGGPNIRVARYATFGTQELADNVLRALKGRTACLLANHGAVAIGRDLKQAVWLAVEIETLARQYYLSLCIGGPRLLPDAEIERVRELFQSYGPKPRQTDSAPPKRLKRGVYPTRQSRGGSDHPDPSRRGWEARWAGRPR